MYELVHKFMLITLVIANVFTACVLFSKASFWLGGSLILVSIAMIGFFWNYCYEHVLHFTMALPLQVVDRAPVARIRREAYLPPPLRRGAVGWFPEVR